MRLLNGSDVGGLFHHAYQALVAGNISAVASWINISDVITYRTKMKFFFKVADGPGQCFSILPVGAQDMECHALRALAAHAGKLLQFIDELSHGLGEFRHKLP